MENVASKIKALNFPEESLKIVNKFLVSLSDEVILLEEEVRILNFLEEKGIHLEPSSIKVLASGYSYIEKQVLDMEELGELQAFVEDPTRINSKGAVKRLRYMKAKGEEYKSPDGKYAKAIFSKKAFTALYGLVDLDDVVLKQDNKPLAKNDDHQEDGLEQTAEIKPLVLEEVQEEAIKLGPTEESIEPALDDSSTLSKDLDDKKENISNPAQEDDDLDLENNNLEKSSVSPSLTREDFSEYTGEMDLSAIEASFNDVISESIDNSKEEKKDLTGSVTTESFTNPYEEILTKPQTIGLNDDTFDRYEKLADSIRHILVSVYNIDEVNDTITDNLIKLITNGVEDDREVLYYAITFGKIISEEEMQRLKSAIEEELEYTSILDIDLDSTSGRAA